MTSIHPTALVSPGAEIGADATVGPYCIVHDHVKIGPGTVLSSFVTILDYVEIGANCRVAQNAVLGGEPQDHGFRGEESWVRIGSDVIIRENVTIHRSTGEGTSTVVGDGCFIMEGVHLGHNVVIGRNVTMANKVGMAGFSSVGDGAVLGGMAGVHQFVRVGKLCMIGGLSKIVKDVPPFLMADGHPAEIFSLNKVGMRRAGYDAPARAAVKSFYDGLFGSGLPFRASLEVLASSEAGQSEAAREIIDFCTASKRGVALWHRRQRSERSGEDGHGDQAPGA
jgi:UDP-N-acetylglucosamine acyltransferase